MKKILFISLAVVLALSSGLIGCTPEEGEGEGEGEAIPYKNDGKFVQQTIGLGETLDPAAAYDTSSGEQLDYVYEPLIKYEGTSSDTFEDILSTAHVWNATALTWTFTIRAGVTFHEGGTLTPEDVEYSFERSMIYDRAGGPAWMLFEPLLGCYYYGGTTWAAIDAAVEVDGGDVVFTLIDAGFKTIWLQTIANSWGSILDKEWCVANGEWDGTEGDIVNHNEQEDGTTHLWNNMNGTGPWKLNLWNQAEQIKVEKFDGYWRDLAPFDWVITQLVEEWTLRKQAILAGDADRVDVPRMYIDELEGISDLTVITDLPALVVVGLFFVLNITPSSPYIGSGTLDGNGIPGDFFTDDDVRYGMCKAFDYPTFLADVMMGEAIQPGSPVVDGLFGYNPAAAKYSYCLTAAATHFQAAWSGNVWSNGFKFTLLYNAGNDMRKSACDMLAANLFAINPLFQVSVLPLAWSTGILPLIKTQEATNYVIGWGADYPHAHNFIQPFMHSTGVFAEYQSYGYPVLDAKIEAALLETDPETQEDLYFDLQQIFYDDAPGVMLYQPSGRRYFTKYISGFVFNPMTPGDAGPVYYMSKSES